MLVSRSFALTVISALTLLDSDQGKLTLLPASVEDVVVKDDGAIGGVVLGNGQIVQAKAVVLTTGTFLRGEICIGTG